MNAPTGTLDPFEARGNTQIWVGTNIYETLFNFNETTGAIIPWLATGYTENPNGSVWTVYLRNGVTFSDGTPFNATAVKDNIDWQIVADNSGSVGQLASVIKGANAYLASNHTAADIATFEANDGIKVVNATALTITLPSPYPAFLNFLDQFYLTHMVSPTAILAHGGIKPGVGNAYLATASAGTGPYVLTNYNSATGSIILSANPHWWASSQLGMTIPFKEAVITVNTNTETEELDLRTGVANVITLPSAQFYDFANKTSWVDQHQLVSQVKGVSLWGPYPLAESAVFLLNTHIKNPDGNLSSVQPFQNVNMVKGFNEAWNESAFIQQSLNGLGIDIPGVIQFGQLGYTNFTQPDPYNLTAAKADIKTACAALGCSPSKPLSIMLLVQNDPISEAASAVLASNINSLQAGVTVEENTGPVASIISYFLTWQEGVFFGYFSQSNYDPITFPIGSLVNVQAGGEAAVLTGFNNSQINSLIIQAENTTNETARGAIYAQINQITAGTGHYIEAGQFDNIVATTSNVRVVAFQEWESSYLPVITEMAPAG